MQTRIWDVKYAQLVITSKEQLQPETSASTMPLSIRKLTQHMLLQEDQLIVLLIPRALVIVLHVREE